MNKDPEHTFGVILLAGGQGSRMKQETPKQLLPLAGKTMLEHSLNLFAGMPQVRELVLVLSESYRDRGLFELPESLPIRYADAGRRRQDSVQNGFKALSSETKWICVHDAARPCVARERVLAVVSAAQLEGAAVLGVPCKDTVKLATESGYVQKTLPRELLWKVHTPQVMHRNLMQRGFEYAELHNLDVTDDVSLVENLGEAVRLVLDLETNLKVTTPEDLPLAERILISDSSPEDRLCSRKNAIAIR